MESSAEQQHLRDAKPFGDDSRSFSLFSFLNASFPVPNRPPAFGPPPWSSNNLSSDPSPWMWNHTRTIPFGSTLDCRPPATTWPFLSSPQTPAMNTHAPSDATAALAANLATELTRCDRMEFEAGKIQRELKYAFHVSASHQFEWLQDDAKVEELEDALYEGKWRPSRKVAKKALIDSLQQQVSRTNDMISLYRGLEEVIESKELRATMMEGELETQREQFRDLERTLVEIEEERKKNRELIDCLRRAQVNDEQIQALNVHMKDKLAQDVARLEKEVGSDAKVIQNREEQINYAYELLQKTVEALELNQQALCQKTLHVDKVQKSLEKAEKGLKAREKSIVELNQRIAAQEKKYDGLEKDIKDRIRDVRVREDTVKAREHELKSESRGAKETTKESGKELKTLRTQLKASEAKALELEKKLQSAADEYQILKLDFETTLSELEVLKAVKAPTQKPDEKIQEQFRKLKEERDKFRGLYETARTNEPIIQDRVSRAVRLAKAETTTILNTSFEVWKDRTKQVINSTDMKLQAAEARAKMLEKQVSERSVEVEARTSEILKDTDERMQDLCRAKLGLVEDIRAKNVEISWLKQRLAALGCQV